jgi:glucose-6-phosphate isomerase
MQKNHSLFVASKTFDSLEILTGFGAAINVV